MDIGITTTVEPGGRAVLAVSGAIDVQSRQQLEAAGVDALKQGAKTLVLDLAGVTFIDSTGIGTLVELGHEAEDVEGELVIRSPSPRVDRILRLTGLEDAWPMEA